MHQLDRENNFRAKLNFKICTVRATLGSILVVKLWNSQPNEIQKKHKQSKRRCEAQTQKTSRKCHGDENMYYYFFLAFLPYLKDICCYFGMYDPLWMSTVLFFVRFF